MPGSPDPRRKGSGRDPELKLLIIRPGAIGDIITSLPALGHLASQADFCEVWVSPACVPLTQFADRVRSIASTGLDLLELGLDTRAREALRDFDRIVSWYGTSREAFRDSVRDLRFTFHQALPAEGSGVHAVDFYLGQVRAPLGAVPRIPANRQHAPRDVIACQPFSGSPRKNWALDKFQALARELPLEFCAGPEENLEAALRFDSLVDVAGWLAGCKAYVGNDSGISHLAAAVGIPVVAIFRCTDPEVWAPRGTAPVQILRGDPEVSVVVDAVQNVIRAAI